MLYRNRMKIDICLPVKNESAILEINLEKLLAVFKVLLAAHNWRLVVSVNGSSDESFKIASQIADSQPNLIACEELALAGKGGAIKHAWRQSKADILVFLDADLAVKPELINVLLEPLYKEEADLVISSRFLPDSSFTRSRSRTIISRGYMLLSRLVLRHHFSDLQCGFKAITKKAFQKIEGQLLTDGWFFDTELVVLASQQGLVVKELPVIWEETRRGQKKSSIKIFRDSKYFLINLGKFYWRLKNIKKKYRDNA